MSRLGEAIAKAGASNADVARSWRVNERIVRDVRAGLRPMCEQKIRALPPSVRRAFLEAELAELDAAAPSVRMGPETHLLLTTERLGETCAETRNSLADGLFAVEEKVTVRKRAVSLLTAVQSFVRQLDRDIRREMAK